MNILILKEITTHGVKINFKNVTVDEQMGFIIGEVQELDNATLYLGGHNTKGNMERVTQEALDVLQTIIQLLNILKREGIDIEEELKKHNKKLIEDRHGNVLKTMEVIKC